MLLNIDPFVETLIIISSKHLFLKPKNLFWKKFTALNYIDKFIKKQPKPLTWEDNIAYNLIESISFEIGGMTVKEVTLCKNCTKQVENIFDKLCYDCYIIYEVIKKKLIKFDIETEFIEMVESDLIIDHCQKHDYEYEFTDTPSKENIPIGSIDYCEKVYGKIKPDYYPEFLKGYLNRKIWVDKIKNVDKGVFIKPYENYKLFTGQIYDGLEIDPETKVYCSEILQFRNEWRYYILNGNMVESGWYNNNLLTDKEIVENIPNSMPDSPKLPEELLELLRENRYYGVLDIGEAIIGSEIKLTLIEACHGYAVGWYTPNYNCYGNYCFKIDKYLKKVVCK